MDELDLMTLARPKVTEPDATTAAETRRAVLAATTKTKPSKGSRGQLWRTPRWAVPATATALVVALVGALVVLPSGAPTAAAEVLLAAADKAETLEPAVTSTIPGGGTATEGPGIRYLKTENATAVVVTGDNGDTYSAVVRMSRESWTAADGSGRIAETILSIDFPTEEDLDGWNLYAGDVEQQLPINDDFGPGFLEYVDYGDLPTDPVAIEQALADRPGSDTWPREVRVFWGVQDLLRDRDAPAELRAALYRVAAGIKGIELLGETTDRHGRSGIGIALTYEGNGIENREWIIFDPDTTQLLGEERQLLTATPEYGNEAPITVWWNVNLDSHQATEIP